MDLSNYRLLFNEEFNSINLTDNQGNIGWNTTYHYGDRFLNNEQQVYVDPDYGGLGLNPFSVSDNGVLTITAEKAPDNLPPPASHFRWGADDTYTSGLITSEQIFSVQYGYFEIRAEMPAGDGLWPAFWLLQSDGQWPSELDVIETLGHAPDELYATVHTKNEQGEHEYHGVRVEGFDSSDGFHTYGLDWQEDTITWYFDGEQVFQTENTVYDQSMYVLANLAVGGWATSPDDTSVFPAEFKIDHIRVYQKEAAHPIAEMPDSWDEITLDQFTALDDLLASSQGKLNAWGFSTTLGETHTVGQIYGTWPHHLYGNDHDNYLIGAEGVYNEIDGRGGNDILRGNGGADHFVLRDGDGNDAILDFSNQAGNIDKLVLDGFHFKHFDDIAPFVTQMESGTLLRLDNDQAVFLHDFQASDFTADQFIFVNSVAPPVQDVVDLTFYGSGEAQHFIGGTGTDTIDYSASQYRVKVDLEAGHGSGGDANGDHYSDIENIIGSSEYDTLIGNALDNALYGGDRNDTLSGGAGADLLDGGSGWDTASYASALDGILLDLIKGVGTGDADGDQLLSIERIRLTEHDDVVYSRKNIDVVDGGAGNDVIFGSDDKERLYGGDGDDIIYGGKGWDTIDGGAGYDISQYSGKFSDYSVEHRSDGSMFIRGSWHSGAGDTLRNIERIEFADGFYENGQFTNPLLIEDILSNADPVLDALNEASQPDPLQSQTGSVNDLSVFDGVQIDTALQTEIL